ncbi:hypothetical protein [Streptomyces sp. ISL-100]|uniref:hypothetical protein n=1 Tax=Streptomyces sp. ISL-100 TaxID=2819173 RepID=UPI001BE78C3C|nr:hypothetical protein [Streptomyces sp. ISL-100]MBT2400040.1 hypothetical protein [Streptomyces sp. ISL-100]
MLRWNGFPYADDVAASLTSGPVGLPGAVARVDGDYIYVRLGRAVLRLSARRAPARHKAEAAL